MWTIVPMLVFRETEIVNRYADEREHGNKQNNGRETH